MFNLAGSQGSCHQRAGSVPTLPCRRREGLIPQLCADSCPELSSLGGISSTLLRCRGVHHKFLLSLAAAGTGNQCERSPECCWGCWGLALSPPAPGTQSWVCFGCCFWSFQPRPQLQLGEFPSCPPERGAGSRDDIINGVYKVTACRS